MALNTVEIKRDEVMKNVTVIVSLENNFWGFFQWRKILGVFLIETGSMILGCSYEVKSE